MNRISIIFILALGGVSILASVPAAMVIRRSELNTIEQDFHQDVASISAALNRELQLNFSPLDGLNILFTGSEEVTAPEFRLVAQRYLAQHQEIEALEWAPYISKAQRQQFEIQRRQEYPNFQITQNRQPGEMVTAPQRSEYFPVAFVEPYGGNEPALGFDLGSQAVRRSTLEKSRDSGQTLVTDTLTLVQTQSTQKGFLAFSPIYRQQPQTPQERRSNLRGFVVGVYRLEELLKPAFKRASKAGINLKIVDLTDPKQSELLYADASPSHPSASDLKHEMKLTAVQGRSWVVVAQATSQFVDQRSGWLFLLLPFLGVILLWGGGLFFLLRLKKSTVVDQEKYFQTMANQSPALMWMTEIDKAFSFFNQTWLTFTGRPIIAEVGSGWTAGIHPADLQNWQQTYDSSFDQQIEFAVEHRLRHVDGSYAWILSVGKPRYTDQGEFCGYIGTSVDITGLKQADAQCQLMNHELLQSNQELEQMASVLSHDMREPLRKIKSFAELVQTDYLQDIDETGQRYFSYVIDGADRMEGMIADMLTYARLGSGEQEVELTNLSKVVEQIQQDFSLVISEHTAVIEIGALPEIMINPADIRRVLQNLIANALKFRGEAAPLIEVKASQKKDVWLIEVSDNGIGIAEESLETIFEMFKRLHQRTAYEGTGIGLAICKKIIERYEGSIWADSKVGEGTTFYVTLPVHVQDRLDTDTPFVSVFDF